MSARASSKTPGGAFRILILADNASTRNLAKLALERHLDCAVTLCTDREALFEAAKRSIPDLCLLDVSLGEDSGVAVCQALRRQPAMESVPIIFLSAYKDPAKRVAALKAGGADYLDKPFYPEELVARVTRQVEMHRLRLEKQDQIAEQQALLRVLCHDLVNPVFGAHSLLSLKRENGTVTERTLDLVLDCCQSAMDVIEHVRREHKLVKDRQFQAETVRLSEAFDECQRTLATQFQRKGVELIQQIESDVPLTLNRVVLVHSILNNLLTNALKFSFPGGRVRLRGYGEQGARCVVEVRDEGIGMPAQILEALFDEEAKVSRPGTAGEAGTGCGMPLVKRYVEKSSGSVEIESAEYRSAQPDLPHGTTVRLVFPVSSAGGA